MEPATKSLTTQSNIQSQGSKQQESKERSGEVVNVVKSSGELIVSAFSWEIIKEEDNDRLLIACWCHNEESETLLIRIEDYYVSFYLALPEYYDADGDGDAESTQVKYEWTVDDAQRIHNYLRNSLNYK